MFGLGIDKNIFLYLPKNTRRHFNNYYPHGGLRKRNKLGSVKFKVCILTEKFTRL